MKPPLTPPIPTWIIAGPAGAGKTTLLHGLAQGCPPNERWTVLLNGQREQQEAHWPDAVHRIQLAGGCACCTSRLVFHTHLSRTLRLRRPDRLFIEIDGNSHPEPLLNQLGEAQWRPWLKVHGVVTVTTPSKTLLINELPSIPHSACVVVNRCDEVPAWEVDRLLLNLKQVCASDVSYVTVPVTDAVLGSVSAGKTEVLWPLSQLLWLQSQQT